MSSPARAVAPPAARPLAGTARRREREDTPLAVAEPSGPLSTSSATAADHRTPPATADGQHQLTDDARFVTYNILTGGIDSTDGGGKDESRRLKQLEFLDSLDADVIALQELRGWDADNWSRLWAAANSLDMVPLPPVISRLGRGNHLALLYRPTSVQVDGYEPDAARGAFYHGLGRARLRIKDLPQITVLFTHLCFLGGAERVAEAQWLAGYGDTYERKPQRVALLGDLNTIGANDEEPDWRRIPGNLRSRHCELTRGGEFGKTDRRAIQMLTQAGFHDPFDIIGQVPPRTAGYWSPAERVGHRSDFILANRNLVDYVCGARVHDTAQTRALSDHLPVEMTLSASAPTRGGAR
ncbi:endonuclease/exonuclease/phosphatase family protein [Streptomyces sp. HU2014]|uniref:endonuclease/exonuclease/phosphatase family protein n=1 Tax=Streptomyces sp. HU2014 TaxID=2939414 RepID=UPI00200D5ED8|nr:endonuclease/exonuclease/phosphatase family protein [Streptomyces sp. HU2014]UQI45902.1 endonuclease/exonuclease/phosphatase family protein [Streptomyces sp. HU2014]